MTVLAVPDQVPAHLRRAILQVFPELAAETFSVAGKGWHSLAVDVGDRLIFKFPEGEEAETALRREARLLASVAPHVTIPVPRMSLHGEAPLFSRHGKLPGDTLSGDAFDTLPVETKYGLAADLARFLAELHAIEPATMRAAGAVHVSWWDTRDETLEPVWRALPEGVSSAAREAVIRYRQLGPDPLGEPYGFFDAHGWNMAFDRKAGKLQGMFDFADSGFGPVHREFVPISLISPDLAASTADAYERVRGCRIDRERVFLLTAAMRLSEFAGALQAGALVDWTRALVVDWFARRPAG